MISGLWVDNYKCMVNLSYKPRSFELLYGENGSGKSSVFELLAKLRRFVTLGDSTLELFPPSTLTAWQSRPLQSFELDVLGNGGNYAYRLVIEHEDSTGKNRIKSEELTFGSDHLYQFDGQDAHLYRDNGSPGPTFPFDWSKSAIPTIPERHDNKRLVWFRSRMQQIYSFAIDPAEMRGQSEEEISSPDPRLREFVSWYRHLAQESPELNSQLFACLKEVLSGFSSLRLTKEGNARTLQLSFENAGQTGPGSHTFDLRQLSDGQRCLLALYTIVVFVVRPDVTICIDEPDNFVALRELQPWLFELSDRVDEQQAQCLLISHHPEFVDRLAVSKGTRFARDDSGPVRIAPIDWSSDGISPSESVARGWS